MTIEQARRQVLTELNANTDDDGPVVLIESLTLNKPYGWVFFYNSERFFETENPLYALIGNGPVVVESLTSRITYLGSSRTPTEEIAEFEARRLD